MIERCCICGGRVQTLYKLSFKDITGMASEYTQVIGYCPCCEFAFTQNPFSTEQLKNRYANYSKFEYDSADYVWNDDAEYVKRSIRQKSFIHQNCDDVQSLLEVGAASGYNLSLYRKEGTAVLGIEPSQLNCTMARNLYRVEMFNGVFDEYYAQRSDNSRFDLIILSFVLEHIIDPMDFIRKCRKINNKYIYIEVPTFDYKFVNEPYGMFAEEHVNYFSLQSLNAVMSNAGYTLVNAVMLMEPNSNLPAGYPALSTLWKVVPSVCTNQGKYTLAPCTFSTKDSIEQYLKVSEREFCRIKEIIHNIPTEKRLAVWGTGHHSSMLLANTDLTDKNIIKFYDSDKKKHSFKMFGKPIAPFCEKDITDGTIEAILIATFTAQKPILRILEPYRNQCEIIPLY